MIREFIYKYYIAPIESGGAYTLVDTLTYAAILIVAVFLTIDRSKISIIK